ncbi:hypothetical protein L313_2800 [Acinetobacter haemolyticus CIP 64.3 = MTCC 9819]|uniref:Uncharacterized protein n=1 Tax=Acinetobacter haemolyticus CIP 64.3 = MTCC 9819 TaxID=1217659 RepID=N9EZD1_ACIHA|nr:hypothetical protein [Acinetobacter haemolyticus]ENW15617.1 hypothetical protein F927_03357 [Acinetobacter haemolyticus CIP 64.3 = MTCC 9819]EPR90390.1 hypothetical protein L313_2800 [Acinetobacter haemolyticus CIP 64.3 = MTCC 9819]QXZ26471.1 hypothetical protein I6L22_15075 [Acinetobacter haemolyticus]SPT48660.1 Uncharacterised protein [Acinetobacter haemolyticus]SUU61814.1 Uncharacterised protein [Acinetobacter haemolyticus]
MTTRRQVQTPGAKAAPEETKTTAEKADEALAQINADDEKQPDIQEVEPDQESFPEFNHSSEAILENQEKILEGQKRIENKLDQLLSAGRISAPTKKRWVQGKKGLEYKEA